MIKLLFFFFFFSSEADGDQVRTVEFIYVKYASPSLSCLINHLENRVPSFFFFWVSRGSIKVATIVQLICIFPFSGYFPSDPLDFYFYFF